MFLAAVLFAIVNFCNAFPADHDPFNPLGPWHQHRPPCGLPPFVNKLPADAQNKIREIWKNYTEGMECDDEHHKTREIIHSLPEEVRETIFAGRCGPSFLRNVSKTIRNEFRNVWFNYRLSGQDKELQLKKLAYSLLNGESLALFNKWEEELQVRKAEFAEKVAKLSPDARDSLEKWKALRHKEQEFLASLPKSILEELKPLCRHHKWFSKINEQTKETTENPETSTTVQTTETTEATTETVTENVEESETKEKREERIEKEFALLMDVNPTELLSNEAECSAFY